ncbi:prefoldin subunit [Candidatus Woesearchaeota archaeon]|nr:prefoldin subunit [Candidatus Woesearchaeota archaeon]
MSEEPTQQLMQLEQRLEQLHLQKKQFQQQRSEAEAAVNALGTSKESFKIIGNLMIKQSAAQLKKELEEQQETLHVRIASIEKQEEKMRGQLKDVQQSLMKKHKKK